MEKMTRQAILGHIDRALTQHEMLIELADEKKSELEILRKELARRDGSAARETPGASTGQRT